MMSCFAVVQVRAFAGWPGTSATLHLQGGCQSWTRSEMVLKPPEARGAYRDSVVLSRHMLGFDGAPASYVLTTIVLRLLIGICRGRWIMDAPGSQGETNPCEAYHCSASGSLVARACLHAHATIQRHACV